MSHHLTDDYWELLGPNSPFLCQLFHDQSQQLTQLQTANIVLEDHTMEAQTKVLDAVAKAASAIVQAILTNMPTGSHSSRGTREAKLESFDGSRDKADPCISIMMQLNTFADERIKLLYALSFMHGGIAQVWAENETNMVLSHTSTFSSLVELLEGIERTLGDPDWERTACSKLHALKMMTGIMADKYMAKFKMLMGRTGFNEVTLEDTFIWGHPQLILSKVYSHTSLPSGLDNWKTVMHNLDCLN